MMITWFTLYLIFCFVLYVLGLFTTRYTGSKKRIDGRDLVVALVVFIPVLNLIGLVGMIIEWCDEIHNNGFELTIKFGKKDQIQ